jgi:succinyl-CoA synthetase beta subunit
MALVSLRARWPVLLKRQRLLPSQLVYLPRKQSDGCWMLRNELGGDDMVIKAQVLAGGRGKGSFDNGLKGGVRVIYS